jgi:hypothetical protein
VFINQVPGAVPSVDILPHVKVTSLHGCSVRLTAIHLAPDVILDRRISEQTDQKAQHEESTHILKNRCILQYNGPYVVVAVAAAAAAATAVAVAAAAAAAVAAAVAAAAARRQ